MGGVLFLPAQVILTSMIDLKNVSKDFGRGKILDGVSLRIEPKECVCILGPSDAGKSTLLKLLIGAETPTSGSVTIDGVDLKKIPRPALQLFRRKVGIIFQDGKLLSNRTVVENIAFSMETNGASDSVIEKRVNELLRRMGLTHCKDSLPHQLSAGEQSRTAIARALAHVPLILIADEPLQNLDADQAQNVMQLFRELHVAGMTMIVLTRDASFADALRGRVLRLENGKISTDGLSGRRVRHETIESPKELVKTHIEAIEKRRKIRVTAIHSE